MNITNAACVSLVSLLALSACKPEPDAPIVPEQASTESNPQAVSISGGTPEVAPPPSVAPVAAAAQAIPDISQVERPVNAQGDPMSDLELLNHLVQELNESRVTEAEIPQKAFKTEAEQMAYEEAQQQKRKGPVRDLNELVTAGVLKAIPQAPAGQRYAIDPATGKVVLQ